MAYLALVCSVSLKNNQKLDKLSIEVADLKKKETSLLQMKVSENHILKK